jgi:hypothetical protein
VPLTLTLAEPMTLYVVRRDTGGPDLEWVAEVEVDTYGVGELRHKGGLEGQVDPIRSRTTLDALLEGFRAQGLRVDEVPGA